MQSPVRNIALSKLLTNLGSPGTQRRDNSAIPDSAIHKIVQEALKPFREEISKLKGEVEPLKHLVSE